MVIGELTGQGEPQLRKPAAHFAQRHGGQLLRIAFTCNESSEHVATTLAEDIRRDTGPLYIGILKYRLQPEEDHILASPEHMREHLATVMVNRMPQPPRIGFLANKALHLVEL